jgi:peroxiredoxin
MAIMAINVGDKIPSATLRRKDENGITQIKTDDLFKGKKTVLFSVPGAFTPTCSAKHLPGFVQNSEALKGKGVDQVVCMAVNDAFVMDAWGKAQNVGDKVQLMADGNGEFAKALGLDFDASGPGLGVRSQRFSMLIDDGVVKKINIEKPGAFEVSSAEAMLAQL